ncbi:hypothetical protein F4604DRAFT_1924243 [Suillus subluteus]|nr:hypothetical protein F4604DRAFT_1924243 [Suillus subluteus]
MMHSQADHSDEQPVIRFSDHAVLTNQAWDYYDYPASNSDNLSSAPFSNNYFSDPGVPQADAYTGHHNHYPFVIVIDHSQLPAPVFSHLSADNFIPLADAGNHTPTMTGAGVQQPAPVFSHPFADNSLHSDVGDHTPTVTGAGVQQPAPVFSHPFADFLHSDAGDQTPTVTGAGVQPPPPGFGHPFSEFHHSDQLIILL